VVIKNCQKILARVISIAIVTISIFDKVLEKIVESFINVNRILRLSEELNAKINVKRESIEPILKEVR